MTATHGEGAYGNAVGVTTPTDHKMAQVAEFVKTGVNTIRPGLLWDGNATVVTGKASMGLDIRAFSIVTSRSATLGALKWANDATVTLTKDVNGTNLAAPGSNSVYWNVFAWHREYSIDGTDSNPIVAILVGTSAASPTVPALTSYPGAVSLATVLVPAGTTATNSGTTITQTAPFTTVDGGVVVARTTTERDAYTPAAADIKAKCFVLADGVTYKWNGSAWKGWESDWITYTPTLTGFTLGNGSSAWAYKWIGGEIAISGGGTLGSTSAVPGSAIVVSLPVNRAALVHPYAAIQGSGSLYDLSATSPYVIAFAADNTSVTGVRLYATASGQITTAINSTTPFTWATGDSFDVYFQYRTA